MASMRSRVRTPSAPPLIPFGTRILNTREAVESEQLRSPSTGFLGEFHDSQNHTRKITRCSPARNGPRCRYSPGLFQWAAAARATGGIPRRAKHSEHKVAQETSRIQPSANQLAKIAQKVVRLSPPFSAFPLCPPR